MCPFALYGNGHASWPWRSQTYQPTVYAEGVYAYPDYVFGESGGTSEDIYIMAYFTDQHEEEVGFDHAQSENENVAFLYQYDHPKVVFQSPGYVAILAWTPTLEGIPPTLITGPVQIVAEVRPAPRIFLNGSTDITGSTSTVIIGEKVVLDYGVCCTPASSHQWVIPGVAVAGYSMSPSGASITPINTSQAQQTIYWKNPGTAVVEVSVVVNGVTGSNHTTFNVVGPTVSMIATGASASQINIHSGPVVRCGTSTGSDVCAEFNFSFSMPSGYSGTADNFIFSQFASLNISRTNASSGAQQNVQCFGNDTSHPYPKEGPQTTSDSPSQPLAIGYSAWSRTDTFTMTLLFKPSLSGAIFVPVRSVDWSWAFQATSSDGGNTWSLPGRTPPGNLSVNTNPLIPTWTSTLPVPPCPFP